jgi:hypothetical protein
MLRRVAFLALKMKTCSFETSWVNTRIYQSTRRNIPKDLEILSKDISVKITSCAVVNIYKPALHQMWSDKMTHTRVSEIPFRTWTRNPGVAGVIFTLLFDQVKY